MERVGLNWRRRGKKSRGAQGQSVAGATPVPDLVTHTPPPHHQNAQRILCTGQGGDGWGGQGEGGGEEERQRSAALTRLQSSAGRGEVCPRPAPSNLRERPFSSRGGNTAGFKEDKIPAGLHTHSGAGGKAAQSRDLGIQRGRTQCCHGGSPGMAFWGCCGHCSLAPEEAAVTRLMGGQSCGESSTELELRRRHWALLSALRFLPSQAIRF